MKVFDDCAPQFYWNENFSINVYQFADRVEVLAKFAVWLDLFRDILAVVPKVIFDDLDQLYIFLITCSCFSHSLRCDSLISNSVKKDVGSGGY